MTVATPIPSTPDARAVDATAQWTGPLVAGVGPFEAALYWLHDPGDSRLIPVRVMDGLLRYRNTRLETGGFLRAVLENNLLEACVRADLNSLRALPAIVNWCHLQLPSHAWGSPDKVIAWLRREDERPLPETEESEV